MKAQALFLVTSDPLSSGRAAEAVRIAAGLQAWDKMVVCLYLAESVVRSLLAESGLVVDETTFRECLPLLVPPRARLLGPESVGQDMFSENWDALMHPVDDAVLAALARQSRWVLRF